MTSDWPDVIMSPGFFNSCHYHSEKQLILFKIIVSLDISQPPVSPLINSIFNTDCNLRKNQKILSPTKNTPEVILDRKGIIKMAGRLIPENAEEFFNPIEEWINEYFCNPAEITQIEICLEYINSTGSKYLFYLMHKIINIRLRNNTERFIINWYFKNEDEDILEKGRFFSSNLDVPFNFIIIS